MAAPGKLPPFEKLMEHVNDGLINREIAELYEVTPEAVRQALARGGFIRSAGKPSHTRWLPWRLRATHNGDVLVKRLRAYSKRQQGIALGESEERLLDEWVKFMEGDNSLGVPLSVHYDRMDDEGFWLEPRQPSDDGVVSPPAR